jgi:3',5'-cyclic AMP phosphodiesterase CpdA
MRIVQISDTHLNHLGGVTNRNFERLVRFINDELEPDLVVHSGDLSILTPDSPEDKATGRELHDQIQPMLRIVPGNHDIGEAGHHPWAGLSVSSARVGAFRDVFGHDHWVEIVAGSTPGAPEWAVIGIDSEVLGSGLPEEGEQWAFLEKLPEVVGDRPAVLFLHKPLWSPAPNFTKQALSVTDEQRDRILATLAGVNLRAVGAGHLHRYAAGKQDELVTVLAPSTAFLAAAPELGAGLEQLGVVEYECSDDGQVTPMFRSMLGLEEREPWTNPEFIARWEEVGAGPIPSMA